MNRGYATFISLALLSAAFVISACGLVHRLAPEHRKRQNLRWLLIWFIKGLVLPVALIPQFFILQQLGLFDTRIGYILLWLSRMAFPVFVLTGFIKGIPSELDDAAAIDGCGYIRYVFQIIMPLLTPALGVVGLIVTIRVWNDIINPVIFLPSRAIKPMSAARPSAGCGCRSPAPRTGSRSRSCVSACRAAAAGSCRASSPVRPRRRYSTAASACGGQVSCASSAGRRPVR